MGWLLDVIALAIASGAAVFAGLQWRESRDAKRIAQKSMEYAREVGSRGAVKWSPFIHSRLKQHLHFENVGTAVAYDAAVDDASTSQVRLIHAARSVGAVVPGGSFVMNFREVSDLADMPERVTISYSLEPVGGNQQMQVVSLGELREEADRVVEQARVDGRRRY